MSNRTADTTAGNVATWMSPARCWQLLAATRVSRVAFIESDRPRIVVLNHVVDGSDILFQTSEATTLARLTANGSAVRATVETDSASGAMHSGWSIVATGRLARITPDEADRLPTPWRRDAVGVLLRLTVEEIHGQLVGP